MAKVRRETPSLAMIAPAKLRKGIDKPDPAVLFTFEPEALSDGRLAR